MSDPTIVAPLRWLLRLGLGTLILATGLGKALDLGGFVGVLQTYQLGLGDGFLHVVAPAIALLEIALGSWILNGWRLRAAMSTAIGLNAAYFVLLTTALLRGLDLENCGCFGVFFARPLRWYSPLEDLAAIAACLALLGLSAGELRVCVSLIIRAPCEKVMEVYRDIARWPRMFPTIRAARVVHEDGAAQVIVVDHRLAGRVINTLRPMSPCEIELDEVKPKYSGRFLNRFEPVPEGTRYTVVAKIRPNGLWQLVSGPWLNTYVQRQLARLVLEPVRRVAEGSDTATPAG